MSQKKYRICFGEEDISITRASDGQEIVYWHREEWEQEPEIVFSICNAIKMAAEGSDDLLTFLQKDI